MELDSIYGTGPSTIVVYLVTSYSRELVQSGPYLRHPPSQKARADPFSFPLVKQARMTLFRVYLDPPPSVVLRLRHLQGTVVKITVTVSPIFQYMGTLPTAQQVGLRSPRGSIP